MPKLLAIGPRNRESPMHTKLYKYAEERAPCGQKLMKKIGKHTLTHHLILYLYTRTYLSLRMAGLYVYVLYTIGIYKNNTTVGLVPTHTQGAPISCWSLSPRGRKLIELR